MAVGPGEAVVGPFVERAGHLAVDASLQLDGHNGRSGPRLTVVGEAVFPYLGGTAFGDHVLVTSATADSFGQKPLDNGYLLKLAPGTRLRTIERVAGPAGLSVHGSSSPPSIVRLNDALGTDVVLVAFFAFFGLAVYAFGAFTMSIRQRREYAVIRAIGFRRRQVVAAFVWQAAASLVIAGVLAVPVGAAIGRAAWAASSRNLGVLDAFSVPLGLVAVSGVIAAAVLGLCAVIASVGPIRSTVASGLRAE
jgi:hypothetical protein